jgi:hypothetical protein
MTVCIAAASMERNVPQIILCHDWQGTVPGIGSTDAIDKQRFIGNGWLALMAGDLSHAEELVSFLDDQMPKIVTAKDALSIVRKCVFLIARCFLISRSWDRAG